MCRAGPERCCKVMVKAPNPCRLHPTYISYVYKVFEHLDELWMGVWVHPYTVTLVQVGVDFWKIYVGPGPSDVVRSWLRLQTCVDCIPHTFHMYTKCLSTLVSCGWAYGCTLTLLRLCRWGWILRKFMCRAGPEQCCKVMVEAPNPRRLHPTSISNVYKVF